MYLFSELSILPLLFLFALWGIGGWLITARLFDLGPGEHGIVGFTTGLVVSNWLANLLVRVMPISVAFWVAALMTVLLGLVFSWPLKRDLLPGRIRWAYWLIFVSAVLIFTLIGRGLGMLDDFQNLPVTSLMATGDIPPHLPIADNIRYGYHYFLILLAVQFVRVGQTAPWVALELARGLTLANFLGLSGVLAWRLTQNRAAAWASAVFVGLSGGTRWLLLLLPVSILKRISDSIQLIGSGIVTAPDLYTALALPWKIAGDGPIPFPFAFANGINPPSIMAFNGYGVSALMIIVLLLLLADRRRDWRGGSIFVVLLASMALANEVNFALLCAGFLLVALAWGLLKKTVRPPRSIWFWLIVTVSAGLLSLVQGGMFTELFRSFLGPPNVESASYFKVGFSLVPPQVVSSHLGILSLGNPWHLLTALLEAGPVLLVLPLALLHGLRSTRAEKWFEAALIASAVISLFSIFTEYYGNAGVSATTRLLSNLFIVCKVFAVPLVWLWVRERKDWLRLNVQGLGGLAIFGGIVLFGIQLTAVPRPVYSYFITDMDARMQEKYWNRLSPPDAWVFDPDAYRAPTLFGRGADAIINWGVPTPEWEALLENPDPYLVHQAGYDYMYFDKDFWKRYQTLFEQACVEVLDTVEGEKELQAGTIPDFRMLISIRNCE